jgi:hypothetical protein
MDNKLILVVVVWLSGLVAGVILVARWMRMGERQLATTRSEPIAEQSTPPSVNKIQRAAHRLTDPVVVGVKADLHMVRNAADHLRHRDTSAVDVRETANVN